MIDCPKCGAHVDGLRCPNCATAERAPVQGGLGVTGGRPAPARWARIAELLANPFPPPSTKWARELLERHARGERISRIQLELASAAVPSTVVPTRARQPGDDDEEVYV